MPVEVGASAPDFTLTGTNGQKISLSALKGQKHAVMIFYRGQLNERVF